jgi:5-oxopent-3-ene-1,2,5-tricarboxylate decarboxylase / 2-hydroxyhepta-2,4-diene-1,7-dioate isomerase
MTDIAEIDKRIDAVRDDLSQVSTATACQLLDLLGWRNTYMLGLSPLKPLGEGVRIVGRARTCRYLMRRAPHKGHDPEARRKSAEIVTIESVQPGEIVCIDALGLPTAGIIGDILSTRMRVRGALAALVYGSVRDTVAVKDVGLPVFCVGMHPGASGRELVAVDHDIPINMGGAQVLPGDVILADDEGALAMPIELAEHVAEHGMAKEQLEIWIRGKIDGGGSVHDYYPPTPEKVEEYEKETGRSAGSHE